MRPEPVRNLSSSSSHVVFFEKSMADKSEKKTQQPNLESFNKSPHPFVNFRLNDSTGFCPLSSQPLVL